MNRTLCTMKYDIQSMTTKITNIEDMMMTNYYSSNNIEGKSIETSSENKFKNEISNLPLENEVELDAFENNLFNNDFRIQMVL